MPNIHTIAPEKWDVRPSEEGAAAYERVGRYVGQAYKEVGSDIQSGVDTLAKNQAAAAQINMQADLTSANLKAHQAVTDFMNKATPDDLADPDVMTKLHDNVIAPIYAQVQQKHGNDGEGFLGVLSGNKYGSQLQERLSAGIQDGTANVLNRATGEIASTNGNLAVQKADEAFGNIAIGVHDHPETLSDGISQVRAMADSMPLPADKREEAFRVGATHTADSYFDGIAFMAENPKLTTPDKIAAAQQLMQDPNNPARKYASPGMYEHTMDRLNKAAATYGQMQTDLATVYLPSAYDALQKGPNPQVEAQAQQIIAAMKPGKEQAEATLKLQEAKDFGQATTQYRDQPDSEILAGVHNANTAQGVAPLENQPQLQAMAKAGTDFVARRRAEIDRVGSAQYAIENSPSVQSRAQAYSDHPNPDTFNAYASASVAYQHQIEPDKVPSVLTDDIKADIKTKVAAIDQTPQGALQLTSTLSQLRDLTGSYYQNAIHELMAGKIINSDMAVTGLLLARPESQALAQEVASAAAVPPAEMNKVSPLDEARATAIARAAFLPLASTMHSTANGDDQLNAYIGAAADVLRQRAVQGGPQYLGAKNGGQVSDDATALANQMVLGRIQVKGGMRIPVGMDADDVNHGAQGVQADMGNHDVIAPPYYSTLINGKDRYAKDIGTDGYWVTNPKGDGAVLYFQGAPVQEKGPKGVVQTVSIPFAQMQQLGAKSRSALDLAKRFITNPESVGAPAMPPSMLTEPPKL